MIDLEHFRFKLQSFPSKYMKDFDDFWKWKLETENGNKHILDNSHREKTYHRLCEVLRRWQTYRGGYNPNPWRTLEDSLQRISDAYNQIREYGFLEFSEAPDGALELVWHELGRVKEWGGYRSKGVYYIISVCKPLMLIWGQTMAFDSCVRENIPPKYQAPKSNCWSFRTWKMVLKSFEEELKQNPKVVDFFINESLRRYKNKTVIPYGRFLDIYYF